MISVSYIKLSLFFASALFFSLCHKSMPSAMDAAESWQIGFQSPATPLMEGIVNLHNHIMFFMIVIGVLVMFLSRKSLNYCLNKLVLWLLCQIHKLSGLRTTIRKSKVYLAIFNILLALVYFFANFIVKQWIFLFDIWGTRGDSFWLCYVVAFADGITVQFSVRILFLVVGDLVGSYCFCTDEPPGSPSGSGSNTTVRDGHTTPPARPAPTIAPALAVPPAPIIPPESYTTPPARPAPTIAPALPVLSVVPPALVPPTPVLPAAVVTAPVTPPGVVDGADRRSLNGSSLFFRNVRSRRDREG
jgi:hypothetical protein